MYLSLVARSACEAISGGVHGSDFIAASCSESGPGSGYASASAG